MYYNPVLSFAAANGLGSGDALIGPKSNFQVVQHFIVYIGKDPYGRDLYMDNNVREGVRYMFEEQLLKENPISTITIRKLEANDYERTLAMRRAESLHGRPYHVSKFNCEHFVNFVQYNIPFSTQIDKTKQALVGVGLAAGLVLLFGAIARG